MNCTICGSNKESIKQYETYMNIKGTRIHVKGNRLFCECGALKYDRELDQAFSEKAKEIWKRQKQS